MSLFGLFGKRQLNALDLAYLEIIREDLHILARKRFQLLKANEYGVLEYTKWGRAWDDYWLWSLTTKAKARGLPINGGKSWSDITDFPEHAKHIVGTTVKEMLVQKTEEFRTAAFSIEGITPTEFEIAVAEKLKGMGWEATVTKGSGDQGADVVARRNSKAVVLQCKYYGRPVGNKAVQEITAARDFYSANAAYVVTNSSYTKAAEELANATNVQLLHFVELAKHFSLHDG